MTAGTVKVFVVLPALSRYSARRRTSEAIECAAVERIVGPGRSECVAKHQPFAELGRVVGFRHRLIEVRVGGEYREVGVDVGLGLELETA